MQVGHSGLPAGTMFGQPGCQIQQQVGVQWGLHTDRGDLGSTTVESARPVNASLGWKPAHARNEREKPAASAA